MKIYTRFRILNAARAMVAEVGVERVTMRGIAARANITAPAIYRHFRNKRHLLDEVIASGYRELASAMLVGNREPNGQEGLEAAIEQTFIFAESHPNLTRMMLAPGTDDALPIRRLETQLSRGMDDRSIEARNPKRLATMFWAQLRGQLSMRA